MDIYTPVAQLRDDLKAAEIRAVLDGQDLNPPAVYVTPDRITDYTMCGGELNVSLFLVVGDVPEGRALKLLGPLLDEVIAVLVALDLPIVEDVTTELLQPSAGGTPLPALKVTTTLTV